MTRIEICSECSFYKGKCTFCGCSGKGVIDDPASRCPRNLWEDGWGINLQPCIEELSMPEPEIMIWDEETQTNISSKEIKEKMNPLYVFQSEDEFKRFVKFRNMMQL